MGIIGCKLDFNYNQSENQEEVKMDESILKKIYFDYNNSNNQEQYKANNNYNTKNYGCEMNAGNASGYTQFENHLKMNKYNCKIKNNKEKKIFGLKKNKNDVDNNNDELIIITPNKNNNNYYLESFNNNEITDEYTIKNETGVYNNDNIDMKTNNTNGVKEDNKKDKINSNLIIVNSQNNINETDNKKNNNIQIKNRVRNNSYVNDKKKQKQNIPNNNKLNSKSFIAKRKILTKKLDLNNPIPKEQKKNNSTNDSNKDKNNEDNKTNKSLPEHKKDNLAKNNVIKPYESRHNNNLKNNNKNKNLNKTSNNNINEYNPLYESFQFKNNIKKNVNQQQTSTIENKNLQLKNILLQQLPLITKEEIIPNIERKTYQEDIIPIKGQKIPKNRNLNKKNINQLCTEHNNYFLLKNNNEIMDKLKDIYQALAERNQLLNYQNNNYKKSKSPQNIYNNSIHRKDTNYHGRNKSFSNNGSYTIRNNNDYNNSFFSLFNNSTNLSINFINKANKCTQSARRCQKIKTYKNKGNEKNYKYSENSNYICNPFSNYNNFDKKHYSGKKNKTCIKKVKPKISNSKSFNNALNISDIQNNNKFSQQYRDLIEVYMPQKEGQTLIDCNIINNIVGNKCLYSYKKIDNYDTKIVLYDGDLYKVIDNMNEENKEEKYKLLPRYFQITKNCFKYFNDMNEAINNNDKPLVQFDIRFIQNVEIVENNFLEKYKINDKNIELVFCIYINQNNDFFVFAHDNKKIANSIINILLFLIRYYEDK